jgi:peptidoglycan/LPS O-acetylase OafA/YrhL
MAVLSVVTSHLWHSCVEFHICAEHLFVSAFLRSCSITGVSFFFVHTCLVLMLSMHRAPDAHRARSFLIRRAFRIYPLCWTAIFLALATGLTDLSASRLHALGWRDILANLLLVQNLAKTRNAVCVLGPLWSLPWEVQMYLVLPLFYIVLRRFQWLGTVFLIWAGSAILAVVGTQPRVPHLGWSIFPPMFIAGMVAYRLLVRQEAQGHRFAVPAWAWPLVVLILFVVAPLLADGREIYTPAVAAINACNCFLLSLAIPYFQGGMDRPTGAADRQVFLWRLSSPRAGDRLMFPLLSCFADCAQDRRVAGLNRTVLVCFVSRDRRSDDPHGKAPNTIESPDVSSTCVECDKTSPPGRCRRSP